MPLDPGAIELIGTHLLIAELLADGIEVAIPIRDRGVDLIAYLEKHDRIDRFYSRPIQLKVASKRAFSLDEKYANIRDVLMVYVWGATGTEADREFYAMTYEQAKQLLVDKEHHLTKSWTGKGKFAISHPALALVSAMQPYKMARGKWAALVTQQAVGANGKGV